MKNRNFLGQLKNSLTNYSVIKGRLSKHGVYYIDKNPFVNETGAFAFGAGNATFLEGGIYP
jgi:hypothetical protein